MLCMSYMLSMFSRFICIIGLIGVIYFDMCYMIMCYYVFGFRCGICSGVLYVVYVLYMSYVIYVIYV